MHPQRPAAQANAPTIAVGEPNPASPPQPPATQDGNSPSVPAQTTEELLTQLAGAIGPMLSRDVLPVLQADHALQERMATAAGRAAAQELKPWVVLAAGSIAVYVTYKIVKHSFYTTA